MNIRYNFFGIFTTFFLFFVLQYSGYLIIQSDVHYFVNSFGRLLQDIYLWNSDYLGINNTGNIWNIFPLDIYYSLTIDLFRIPAKIAQLLFISFLLSLGFYFFVKCLKIIFGQKINKIALLAGGVFYLTNTYLVVSLANSFLLLLPYAFLPVQLFYFINGLEYKKYYHIFVAGFVSVFYFGVNLVFGVINILVVVLFGLWKVYTEKSIKLLTYTKYTSLMFFVIFCSVLWWFAPMIFSALANISGTNFVLHSESFYNLDTSPINVLRNFGYWSFFQYHNGVPYFEFAFLYNESLFFIITSFFIPFAVFLGIFNYFDKNQNNLSITFFIIILLISYPLIGGLNSDWPSLFVFAWLFEHIPFFSVFRNTYKFTTLTVFSYSVLLSFVTIKFLNLKYLYLRMILVSLLLMIVIGNAYPFYSGQLFASKRLVSGIPSYWRRISQDHFNNINNRVLLLPRQYFEFYRWNDKTIEIPGGLSRAVLQSAVISKSCGGCVPFLTEKVINSMYESFDNIDLSRLSGFLGISHILQRNDFDYKYYNVESPDEIKNLMLRQGDKIKLSRQEGELDLYTIDDSLVYSRLYSPKNIIRTKNIDEFINVFGAYDIKKNTHTFFVQDQVVNKKVLDKSSYYEDIFTDELQYKNGLAQYPMNSLATGDYLIEKKQQNRYGVYSVSYTTVSGGYNIIFEKNEERIFFNDVEVFGSGNDSYRKSIFINSSGNKPLAVDIEGTAFYLEPNVMSFDLGYIELPENRLLAMEVFTLKKDNNIMSNGSFEAGLWDEEVGNCDLRNENALLDMQLISNDSTEGLNSLSLIAYEDAACTHSEIIRDLDSTDMLLLQFDYKNISGSQPVYCVWDGSKCIANEKMNSVTDWGTYKKAISPTDSNFVVLYMYSYFSGNEPTVNQYDNIQLYKMTNLENDILFTLENKRIYKERVYATTTDNNIVSAKVVLSDDDLLENGDFESGLWKKSVGNCRYTDPDAKLDMQLLTNKDNKFLELYAEKDIACTSSQPIRQQFGLSTYILAFDYKILEGIASYCIWDGRNCLVKEELHNDLKEWSHFEKIFEVNENSGPLTIYLYAPATDHVSRVQYDNIQIYASPNSVLDSYYIRSSEEEIIDSINLNSYRINPTLYHIEAKQKHPGLLVFQESFHPTWKAFVKQKDDRKLNIVEKILFKKPGYEISSENHIVANGFANGWWIDPSEFPEDVRTENGEYEIILEYWPQRYFYLGLLISGTTLLSCLGYLAYDFVRRRRDRE